MTLLIILLAKATNFFLQLFNLGSGYTWPGYIAYKIYPNILKSSRIHFSKGVILISGTNGKTTTTKLITHLLETAGYRVTHNKTGANLEHGLIAAILLDMSIFGKVPSDFGVFEVDEYVLPTVLQKIQPTSLVLLNLSRDQLDRYWEIDMILDKWKKALTFLDSDTFLVLASEQKHFKKLIKGFSGRCFYFDGNRTYLDKTKLYGGFNALNVNAAVTVGKFLGIDKDTLEKALSTFDAAYGRGEIIIFGEKPFQIFLAKNPSSFNHNLDIINSKVLGVDTLLFVLNDNIPDGRDVSWIYDIDKASLKAACEGKTIFISGRRRFDMAVRLVYAGVKISSANIFEDLEVAVKAVAGDDRVGNVLVLPNYSAMLQVRKNLVGRKIL